MVRSHHVNSEQSLILTLNSNTVVNDNEWHIIIIRFNSNDHKIAIFVDGIKKNESFFTGLIPSLEKIAVGRSDGHHDLPVPSNETSEGRAYACNFSGIIDEIFTANTPFTDDLILRISKEWSVDDYAYIIKKTDSDKDKDIDAKDLSIFLFSYGSIDGSQKYNRNLDFDGDGKIDNIDLIIFTSMYGKIDTHLYISDCKYLLKNEGIFGEKLNSINDKKCYDFSLSEPKTIAVLSTGYLDLKGEIFEVFNGIENQIDADKDGVIDASDRSISNGFIDRDISPVIHRNFMLRPGVGSDGEIRILPPGHYRVYISFDDDASFVDDEYGLVLLKRGFEQQERIDDFFSGISGLIEDDGGYEDNDYLDIYVQALFPDIYETNWFGTIDYNGIIAERQCKALPNFFVKYIFGQDGFLYSDCIIDDNISSNDPDWVLRGLATTIFNNLSVPTFGDLNNAKRGDVWVKDMSLTCLGGEWQSGFNHYGLYLDNTSIVDANWSNPTDGKLRISNTRSPNKIVQPEN